MVVVDIYSGTDDIEDMLQSLMGDGLICIFGGRVQVRSVIVDVVVKANNLRGCEDYTSLTFNHFYTELGYVWEMSKYSSVQAEQIVVKKFEKKYGHLF